MQRTKKQHICVCLLTFCATLFFLLPLATIAQTVNIPDTNLRAAIEEALKKTSGATITAEDMATLTRLVSANRRISNLKGLESATNLSYLELHRNSISDISPLAGLVELHHLSLGHNTISDLTPLAGLINLVRLYVSHNVVEDLSPLTGLINLMNLSIGANLITDLSPLTGLTKLVSISMGNLPPADLSPLSALTSLRGFHSWGTPILDLAPLAELPKLQEINICGGDISDISPLANITGLKEIYFAGNQISDLSPLVGLTDLTRVSFEHNEISDVSPLASLQRLKWLDLGDNAISEVAPLSKLDRLTWLNLSKNAVTDVTPLVSSPNLTWVGLKNNAIADISGLDELSEVTPVSHFVNTAFPEAGPKIVGPWLWAMVPGARIDHTDLLTRATNGAATEVKVATFGATDGKAVGSSEWTLHALSPTGSDNINEMTDALGWGSGSDIHGHVVYGSVTLDSPREQETTMLVGSGDAVKVWLNGEVVHYNPVARDAGDFQDAFPVTLKHGANVLLVAVDNRGRGTFSGFFGFAQDADYTVNPSGKKIVIEIPAYDVNRDGITNILDLILVGQDFGKTKPTNARSDVNGDKKVNISDLILVADHLGELSGIAAAPAALALHNSGLDAATIETWIAQARLENDGSLAFQHGIANLQRLLALLLPEKTALLANYPNPFNPETWIPYQLAQASAVQIRIWTVSGTLVRKLDLGHQPAGIYQQHTRAAYWDGRNQIGEPVASGVYFYTLTAGDFTATRKMLIQK